MSCLLVYANLAFVIFMVTSVLALPTGNLEDKRLHDIVLNPGGNHAADVHLSGAIKVEESSQLVIHSPMPVRPGIWELFQLDNHAESGPGQYVHMLLIQRCQF
jgi:hypothetical protein